MIEYEDLHAFVDGELSPDKAAAIQLILQTSAADAKEVDSIRSLKLLLAQKTDVPSYSKAWQASLRRLDELHKIRRTETIVGRLAPGLCVILFGCILLAGRFSHVEDRGLVLSPDLARMVDGLSPVHPPKSAGPKDTALWLDNLIRQSKLLTPDHVIIRGVAVGFIDGIPVKRFSARDGDGNLEIYVIKDPVVFEGMKTMDGHPDLKVGILNGVNCVVRNEGENTILIVSQRPYDELAAVAGEVTIL